MPYNRITSEEQELAFKRFVKNIPELKKILKEINRRLEITQGQIDKINRLQDLYKKKFIENLLTVEEIFLTGRVFTYDEKKNILELGQKLENTFNISK